MSFWEPLLAARFHPSQEPPDWVNILSGWTTATGSNVTPENALQSVAVFACVRVLAESIASLPMIAYRRLPNGGKERATDHYLYSILHDLPNPEMSSFELRETLMGHLGTWGNAYAEIDIDGAGRARELWPLRPDRMKVRRRGGRLEYVYRLPGSVGAQTVVLPAERILHVRGLGFDGVVGYSPIQLARQAVGLGMATEEYGARFFGNDARPGGVLEHPGVLDDEAQERLRESWTAAHQGLEKSHRVAILEEGMKFHEVGLPPGDSQFLETRQFQTTEIARLYRIPPHLIQQTEKQTSWGTGIEQMNIGFATYTLLPWVTRWEQAIWRDILLPGDRQAGIFVKLLMDGLLRGDIQSRYQAYATGRQWGWLSANDVRQLEDMNPVDGGDAYMMPLNMIPSGSSGRSRLENRAEIGEQEREERSLQAAKARRRLAEAWGRVFEDTTARWLRREMNDVGNAARKLLGRRDFPQWSVWLDEFYRDHKEFIQRQMLPVYLSYAEAVAGAAGDEVNTEAGMTPDLEEFVRAYTESFAARQVGQSIGQVRDVTRDAVQAGEDPLAALDERFQAWEETRPAKISMWERFQSGNAVAKFVFAAAGITRLRWRALGENCPYCTRLNGRVVGIKENFLSAGQSFEPDGADRPLVPRVNVGHPPAHGGCDCIITVG